MIPSGLRFKGISIQPLSVLRDAFNGCSLNRSRALSSLIVFGLAIYFSR